MIIEIILAIMSGIGIGIFTGITPGVHLNLVSAITVTSAPLIILKLGVKDGAVVLCVFIIAMAITHTFLDTLPGIYLGAPDDANALSILPGHRMLLQGKGHTAVLLTLTGSLFALIIGIAMLPVFVFLMVFAYPVVHNITGFLLIILVVYLILREKGWNKKALCTFIVILSGTLGILVLNAPMKQPLLPLLSGMFGISTLLLSLLEKSVLPKQEFESSIEVERNEFNQTTIGSSIMGFIAAFLPGFGSSQAAILSLSVIKNITTAGFLILIGGINTANMLVSVGSAYALDKARNGAIVAVNELAGVVDYKLMLLLVIAGLIAAGIAFIITIKMSKVFCNILTKVNYAAVIIAVMLFVLCLAVFFDGWMGLLVLFVSTALGIMVQELGIGKNHLMSCLIIPVIFFFVL